MDRWEEIRAALDKAADLPRDGWAEALATEFDEKVLREVGRWLAHIDASEGFLDPPSMESVAAHLDGVANEQSLPDMTGRCISDRFHVRKAIARDVYAARDALSNGKVAIKFSRRGHGRDLSSDESAALRLLRLPGVVQLLEDGADDDVSFLVMEFVEGRPYPGRQKGRCAWSDIERVTIALFEVVARIHWHGVVHRDLKPSNVLVDARLRPTVLDLGIAWDAQADPAARLRTVLAATPMYAAPEQLRGEPATPRSDLYSLGVMLFEALTGANPHEKGALLRASPDVPEAVASLVARLLDPDPERRPASAGAALAMLPSVRRPAVRDRLRARTERYKREELTQLFHGPERLFRLQSDAAHELWERTRGVPADVIEELEAWDRAGIARWEGDRLQIDRDALERLRVGLQVRIGDAEDARALDVDALARRHAADATKMFQRGQVAGAWAALDAALQVAGDRLGPAETEEALGALLRASIASGAAAACHRFRYRVKRCAVPDDLARRLDRIAHAAIAVLGGDAFRASHLLIRPESAGSDMELQCLYAVWMYVARALPPPDRDASLRRARAFADQAGNERLRRIVRKAMPWMHYQAERYAEAAQLHAEAAGLAESDLDRMALTINAASAWLEAAEFDRAERLGREAIALAGACRHPAQAARGEWICRSARYRRGDRMRADEELVAAARDLESPNIEASINLNEAAIAWRACDYETGMRLALRADAAWTGMGRDDAACLARALAFACGAPPAEGDLATLAEWTSTARDPIIAIQCAALLASVYAAKRTALLESARSRAANLTDVDPHICREVVPTAV